MDGAVIKQEITARQQAQVFALLHQPERDPEMRAVLEQL